jgi:hypothetical protein
MARDGTLYEAWMASKAQAKRGTGAASILKRCSQTAVKVKQAEVPMAEPSMEQNIMASAAPADTETQTARPKVDWGKPLLLQLKGAYGMAMGIAGVVVIVCAFAVGRMYGPKATEAAPATVVPMTAATASPAPAAVAADLSTPQPQPAVAAARKTPTQTKRAANDPWAKLLGEKQNTAKE